MASHPTKSSRNCGSVWKIPGFWFIGAVVAALCFLACGVPILAQDEPIVAEAVESATEQPGEVEIIAGQEASPLENVAEEPVAEDPAAEDDAGEDDVEAVSPPAEPETVSEEAPVEESDTDVMSGEEPAAEPVIDDGLLQFSFEGTPWRDVIRWLASEADLALHVADLPTGSFTYSDTNSFTHQEAIDRVNLFLLPQGFTLIRSGKLLSVINLGDPRSTQQLDALAKLVTVEELEPLNDHDVVKCIFPLGEFEAEEAVQELSALNLMTKPAVFDKTNRLMITDTVGKLKSVKTILDGFEPSTLDNGTIMKNFALKHIDAEDILVVARPHLGLATGEMIGIDVSLSADLQGNNIFVTGVEDKVALIEGLVTALDVPEESLSPVDGEMELRSHIVEGGNVEIVYNVLQTLLAGKSVRLSMDEKAGSIVALATPAVQKEIADTVIQLQASEAEFAVIPLRNVDPYFAISLLEEMLDLADLKERAAAGMEALTRHGNARVLDMEMQLDVPKIDADPENMRLFVRARKPQMEQIKKMVAELDSGGELDGSDEQLRLIPLKGKQAEQILQLAAKFWRGENPIILYPAMIATESEDTERVVASDSTETNSTVVSVPEPEASSARFLTDNIHSQAPAIRCQLTPRGLLLQSEDTEALDRFYEHLRTLAGPTDSIPSAPIVFYLKHAKADEAIRMLAELIDGGESAKASETGSLVNGYVSSSLSDSYLGSIVTTREGTMTLVAGSITIVAETRLNRLIAQGTASDMELIESYLKIIDKDSSITSIEVHGTSRVIELLHTKASEVAAAIREAYSGRVAGASGAVGAAQPGSPQQALQAAAAAKAAAKAATTNQPPGTSRGSDNRSSRGSERNSEPQMTIAVHEPSNSLIVTAPETLFKEVEQLAKQIDARNEQAVRVLVPLNAPAVRSMLEQGILGDVNPSGGRPSSTPSTRTPTTQSRSGR